nr:hypothetical protein [Haladaptatus pallidirubidus]
MVRSRTVTALIGVIASLLISALLWWYFDSFVFFLFVPFIPFFFRSAEPDLQTRRCPTCGFQTTNDAYDYCPRDGMKLE